MKPTETTLTIEKLGNDFEGVCYVKGKRYLVNRTLPKEKVIVDNPKESGSVTIYNLVKVITPSKYRVNGVCPNEIECGACTLLHIDYDYQRKLKTDNIKRRLNEWRAIVEDIEYSKTAKRNKIQLCFKGAGSDIKIGFFNSETHQVVDIPSCQMHSEKHYTAIRDALKKWCAKYDIISYNPHRQRGNLRFAVIRLLGNSILMTLVFYKKEGAEGLAYLYSLLKQSFDFVSLNININSQISNAVFDNTPEYFMGEREIASNMLGVNFLYRAGDFLQTNTEVCEKIYKDVLTVLKESGAETMIDAYSGIGITSSLFAKNGLNVKSVEINENAVETAKNTAKLNGTDKNIKFYSGDFAEVLKGIKTNNNTSIFVDPPRAGLGEYVCKSIIHKKPNQIIYLSCEPDTLIKDLNILKKYYTVTKIKPYDMFVNTKHIETLVCLRLK